MGKNEYFKVKDEHQSFKGEKYFCYNSDKNHVIQINFQDGIGKKNTMGIYTITKSTFTNNYFSFRLITQMTEGEFEGRMELIFNLMRDFKANKHNPRPR